MVWEKMITCERKECTFDLQNDLKMNMFLVQMECQQHEWNQEIQELEMSMVGSSEW